MQTVKVKEILVSAESACSVTEDAKKQTGGLHGICADPPVKTL